MDGALSQMTETRDVGSAAAGTAGVEPPPPRARRGLGSTMTIAATTVLRGVVSFAFQVLLAGRFGAGTEADAWFVVVGLVFFLSDALVGVLTFAALPLIVHARADAGPASAREAACSLVNLCGVLVAATAALMYAGARPVVGVLAPGFEPAAAALTADLLRLGVLSYALYTLALLLGIILQAHERFGSTALVPLFPYLFSGAALLALPQRLGVHGLLLGFTVGTALALVVQLVLAVRVLGGWSFGVQPRHPALQRAGVVVGPVALAFVASTLYPVVQRVWASGMVEGSVSALGYAHQINAIPSAVLVVPLATVLLPRFSLSLRGGSYDPVLRPLADALVVVALVSVLGTALMVSLAEPAVAVLLQRGSFSAEDVRLTARVLALLAMGLVPLAATNLLGRTFYAAGDPWSPCIAGTAAFGSFAVAGAALRAHLDAPGLALLYTLAITLHAALLFARLRARAPRVRWVPAGAVLGRLALAGGAAAVVSGYAFGAVAGSAQGAAARMLALAGAGVLGSAAFVAALAAMRGREAALLSRYAGALAAGRRKSNTHGA